MCPKLGPFQYDYMSMYTVSKPDHSTNQNTENMEGQQRPELSHQPNEDDKYRKGRRGRE